MKTVLHMHRITIANRASLLPLNECLSLIEYVDLIFIIVVLGDNLSRDFSKLYPLLRAKNFASFQGIDQAPFAHPADIKFDSHITVSDLFQMHSIVLPDSDDADVNGRRGALITKALQQEHKRVYASSPRPLLYSAARPLYHDRRSR